MSVNDLKVFNTSGSSVQSVQIPEQLQSPNFRFCKVEKHDKKPFEKGWSKNGYQWNDPSLQSWLDSGGNYGVIGGPGDLVIFDADELDRLVELGILEAFPETFTVMTPGRSGLHYYFICQGVEKKQALYDPEKTFVNERGLELFIHVADLVSHGLQAVGPNSVRYFPEAENEDERFRRYLIFNEGSSIATITKEQLQEAIKGLRPSQKVKKESIQGMEVKAPAQGGYNRWSDSLHVEDVMMPLNPTKDEKDTSGEIQGTHPIHGSEGGHNFAINVKKNNWICYRCKTDKTESGYTGGGPWELLGIREGILSCDDCYKGWRKDRPDLWAEVLKKAEELGYEVPKGPYGDSVADYKRDLIRYAVEIIMGSEHIRTTKSGEIYIYDNGVYRPEGARKITALIERLGGMQATINVKNEALNHIRDLTSCDLLDFDADPSRISVKNGILNLETGELEPHSPDFLTTIQIPVEFKPEADCPTIRRFMGQVVKRESIPLLEEMAGYCLLRDYPVHKGFILLGEGRNGKSTWTNLLVAMVSQEYTSSVPLQQLGKRFKNSEMKGKLINFYTDLPNHVMSYSDNFKIVTSGDPVTIEQKYLLPELVRLYAKQIFSCNELPRTMDESYGFFSRLILIDFVNRFEGAGADTNLLKKLTTPEELSGFLNLAIHGLMRLLKNQQFSYDKTTDDVADEYKKKSAPLTAVTEFMTAATIRDPQEHVLKDDLWLAYKGWEVETEPGISSIGKFFQAILDGYSVIEYRPKLDDGTRGRALRGLKLSPEGIDLKNLGKSVTPTGAN